MLLQPLEQRTAAEELRDQRRGLEADTVDAHHVAVAQRQQAGGLFAQLAEISLIDQALDRHHSPTEHGAVHLGKRSLAHARLLQQLCTKDRHHY